GILLHATGEEGASFGLWMQSIRCRIAEGSSGDLVPLGTRGAKTTVTSEAELFDVLEGDRTLKRFFYVPGAPVTTIASPGLLHALGGNKVWKDEKGFRGENDAEKPVGQWNTLECICHGNRIFI